MLAVRHNKHIAVHANCTAPFVTSVICLALLETYRVIWGTLVLPVTPAKSENLVYVETSSVRIEKTINFVNASVYVCVCVCARARVCVRGGVAHEHICKYNRTNFMFMLKF